MRLYLMVISATLLLTSCEDSAYKKELQQFRQLRNEQFAKPSSSPLEKQDLALFEGLSFFAADEEFKVSAVLEPNTTPNFVSLFPSGSDVKQIHQKIGVLVFKLKNQTCSLSAFQTGVEDKNMLFIPFTDQTSGKSSYGGGRYVEAIKTGTNTYLLDFNYAYHPYCVYNEKYSCALCPPENDLKIAIEAGEKLSSFSTKAVEK